MKKLQLVTVILLALILALIPLLGACGGGEQEEEEEEEELYGGVLRIITGVAGIASLGYTPVMLNPNEGLLALPALEPLLTKDATGKPMPNLATSWEVSSNLTAITLILRQGVKFHDGTDFNAEAAKYSLDLARTSPRPVLTAVESIDVIDDYIVRLNLSQFDPSTVDDLCTIPGFMMSKTAIETEGQDWCMTHPVGTGPFKFLSWERDVSLKYERFDDYWQEGKPYLDGIEFNFIADAMVAQASFLAGEADAIMLRGPKEADDVSQVGDFEIVKTAQSVIGLAGDSKNPDSPFSDVRVRQALNYAIDTQAIVDTLGYGIWETTNQPSVPGLSSYNPSVIGYPYDPQAARDLMALAGYSDDLHLETEIIAQITLPEMVDALAIVQSQLEEVWIDAAIETVGGAEFMQLGSTGWENALLSVYVPTGVEIPAEIVFKVYYTDMAMMFVSIIHPADYQEKVFAAGIEPDDDARAALMQEAIRLMVDEYALIVPLFANYQILAKTPEVHDLMMYEIWATKWTPADAWISGEKPPFTPPPDEEEEEEPPPAELDWSDVPVYTGAEEVEGMTYVPPPAPGPAPENEGFRYFTTGASVDDIQAFYQTEMPENGWQEIMCMAPFPMQGFDLMCFFTKGDWGCRVIVVTLEGQQTLILWKFTPSGV